MQNIHTDAKTGFHTPGAVKVFDGKGLFLEYNYPCNFNLPAGNYTVTGNVISTLEHPVQYQSMELAAPDKPPVSPDMVIRKVYTKEIPGNNGSMEPLNKMAIDYQTGIMAVDPDWEKTLNTAEYEAATNHERGHFFYSGKDLFGGPDDMGERNCDRYSAKTMLDKGYNPPQIKDAFNNVLCSQCSHQSAWRKQQMANEMDTLESIKKANTSEPFDNFEIFDKIIS